LLDGIGCNNIDVGSGFLAELELIPCIFEALVLIFLAPVHDAHDANGANRNTNDHRDG